MIACIVLIILGLYFFICASMLPYLAAKIIFIYIGISFVLVGLINGFNAPKSFFKQTNGKLSLLSYILFSPFIVMIHLSIKIHCLRNVNRAITQIADDIYLGRYISRAELKIIKEMNIKSVLDLTCEVSENKYIRNQLLYKNIPVLDGFAPQLDQLKEGAQWIADNIKNGPVYVHCAVGRGRSAAFVMAYLLLTKISKSLKDAVELISSKRNIKISKVQMLLLKDYEKQLNSKA